MKIAILLVTLLFCVSAVHKEKKKQQGSIIFDKSEVHPFIASLLNLAEVHSSLGNTDFSVLFASIDELADSVIEKVSEENGFYTQEQQRYLTDKDFYNNQITEYTQTVSEHQTGLDDLVSSRQKLEQQLDQQSSNLRDAKNSLRELENTIRKETNQFEQRIKEIDRATEVVDKATSLVSSLAQQTSLVQMSSTSEERKNIASEFEHSLRSISSKKFIYEPLSAALSQMAQSNFANQQSLKAVVDLLNALRGDLQGSRLSLVNQHDIDTQTNNDLSDQYKNRISSLETLVVNINEGIKVKEDQVKAKSNLLKDAQKNLQQAQSSFTANENAWAIRITQHDALLKIYNDEQAILSQAEIALERGGIRRN